MTSKRFWRLQSKSIPADADIDVIVTFPPEANEADILWFKRKLEDEISGLSAKTCNVAKGGKGKRVYAFHISASYRCFLTGLEDMQVPKAVKDELGGGSKEFTMRDSADFKHVEDPKTFLCSEERQAIIIYLVNGIKAEKGDSVADLQFREGEAIFPRSVSEGVVAQIFPVHEPQAVERLRKSWVTQFFKTQPIESIREYFGIKIAFYFAWLGHYTTALFIPAAFGLLVWLCGDDSNLGFVGFAFFNVIWSTLYLESWKRRSAELAYTWGTADQRDDLLAEPRPLFVGEERISKITKRPEVFYPDYKRNVFR